MLLNMCVLDLVQLEDDLEEQYCQVTYYIRRRLNKIQYTDFTQQLTEMDRHAMPYHTIKY